MLTNTLLLSGLFMLLMAGAVAAPVDTYRYRDRHVHEDARVFNDTAGLRRIREVERSMSAALIAGRLDKWINGLAPDAVWLPEYHPGLYTKADIVSYFRQWLDSVRIQLWSQEPYEVYRSHGYLIETGTGRIEYRRKVHGPGAADTPYVYQVKYISFWRLGRGDSPLLVSTIMGSTRDLERRDLPRIGRAPLDTAALPRAAASPIKDRLDSINAQVAALVKSGDGGAFDAYYTDDAIYMPYYRPMQIGRAAIRTYYLEHEHPNSGITDVRIRASRIIDLGDYVLEDGNYGVYWNEGEGVGRVTGKILSVWKHGSHGKLLIWRQMTAHD